MASNRLEWADSLKCFLIIIVVWGHLIQYYSGLNIFWESRIWEIIYSFHMPLFIFISGYFFRNKTNWKDLFKTKSLQLLLPGFSCAIIVYLINCGLDDIQWLDMKHIVESACLNFWFLKTLFVCLLLGIAFFYNRTFCIFSLLFFWVIIRFGCYDYITINLINNLLSAIGGGNGLFFLLPFFIMGYYLRNSLLIKKMDKSIYILISLLLWIFFMIFFKGSDTIYFASATWFSIKSIAYAEILKTIYRDLVALCAIVFWVLLFKRYYCCISMIKIQKTICWIGRNTLGIYVFQYLIVEQNIFNLPFYSVCSNSVICCIMAILIVLLLNLLVHYVRKIKYVSIWFMGI